MRATLKTHLLAFSLLCLLSKVCTQLCPTPCTCPWPPPRCPLGVALVLDGCGCCRVCARRLGEPCDQLHVCDASQGLVCQPGAGPGGRGALCLCKQVCRTEGGCVSGRSRPWCPESKCSPPLSPWMLTSGTPPIPAELGGPKPIPYSLLSLLGLCLNHLTTPVTFPHPYLSKSLPTFKAMFKHLLP
nr:WNT1-inducible-signaling pathway protein 2 isoform X2 [Macaca nemestrina]